MPWYGVVCPRCGKLIPEDSLYCPSCGAPLTQQLQRTKPAPTSPQLRPPPSAPSHPPSKDVTRRYANFGLISAVLGLFFVPEIFGSLAIILGAYAWKMEVGDSKRGLFIVILGIICMIVGIYFTALI